MSELSMEQKFDQVFDKFYSTDTVVKAATLKKSMKQFKYCRNQENFPKCSSGNTVFKTTETQL